MTNFRKLTLLNDQEKAEKLIGYLYIRIFVENENEKKILKEEYSSNYINQGFLLKKKKKYNFCFIKIKKKIIFIMKKKKKISHKIYIYMKINL